jgi:hypothetical protein
VARYELLSHKYSTDIQKVRVELKIVCIDMQHSIKWDDWNILGRWRITVSPFKHTFSCNHELSFSLKDETYNPAFNFKQLCQYVGHAAA